VNNNSVQFLFVTVPTTDERVAVFNALDVVMVVPCRVSGKRNGAQIQFRGADYMPLETTLSPAEVAAATELAMIALLGRALAAAAQMAREAGL
jgi:hypothetical protein